MSSSMPAIQAPSLQYANMMASRFSSIAGTSTGPPSEMSSELSSAESDFSDLRTIAAGLGILEAEEIYTERFTIDRTKLEDMMKTEHCEGMSKAESFFNNLLKENLVHVSWPCRLKIGAKTRKDPHVRIIGRKEEVLRTKDKIMAVLDAKGNRVIMKMDVSYTDHSYIIGRGGNNIKRIMDETQTHIHFPDSNRSNPTEKSNQVSLCGSLEGVEKARALVRESTPLLLSFEMPIIFPGAPIYDNNTPFIKEMEKQYNLQVIFSSRPKLHSSTVLVKGCEKEHKNVIDATRRLIEFMFEDDAQNRLVTMHLEITTSHHPIVVGKNSQTLREIMHRTNTTIIFQNVNDSNVKPIKRSQVTISGPIDGVYFARQQLLGNIPVTVIFDYPDINIESEVIKELMATHDVFISARPKARQNTMCIVMKGIEKFITNIYDARHSMLKLNSEAVIADIPQTYYGPYDMECFKNSQIADLIASSMTYNSSMMPMQFPAQVPWSGVPPEMSWRSRMPPSSPLTTTMLQQHNQIISNIPIPTINVNDLHSSGYSTITSDSSMMRTGSSANGSSSHHSSPVQYSKFSPPNQCEQSPMQAQALRNALNDPMIYQGLDPRVIAGLRAMSISPQAGELRTPTNAWQGMNISRTSPSVMESPMPNSAWIENMPENNVPGLYNMTTSVLDATPVRNRQQISKYDDIVTLLTGLGLEQCIQNFINAEVDMTVFPTLTEQDLISMGIKTLGARRRIMIAVHAHLNNCMQQEFLMQNQQQQQQAPSPPTVSMRPPQQQQQQQQQTPQQISPPQQQHHHHQQQQQSSSPPTPLRGFRFNGSAAPGDERRSSNGT